MRGDAQEGVGFFEEGFAGAGEGGEPVAAHADTLDALAWRRLEREAGDDGVDGPGKKRAVFGRLFGVSVEALRRCGLDIKDGNGFLEQA